MQQPKDLDVPPSPGGGGRLPGMMMLIAVCITLYTALPLYTHTPAPARKVWVEGKPAWVVPAYNDAELCVVYNPPTRKPETGPGLHSGRGMISCVQTTPRE
ncbi:MAG: hypothetical protein AAB421_03090 [Patescibacteria group bacterium]